VKRSTINADKLGRRCLALDLGALPDEGHHRALTRWSIASRDLLAQACVLFPSVEVSI